VAEQLFGLIAHQITHALRARLHGIVVVDTGDRLTRRPGGAVDAARDASADRVVENQHSLGAGDLGHEAFGLRIIDPAQLVLVIEVLDGTAVLDERQAFDVERQPPRDRPGIMDDHRVRLGGWAATTPGNNA
jgi:hypothetical protein